MQVDEMGFGIGLNPPIDIHIPDANELQENIRKSQEDSIKEVVQKIFGKDLH